LVTFRDTSMPVIDFYQKQGKVKSVNSERDVAEVYEDSRHILSANGFPLVDIYDESEEVKLLKRVSPHSTPPFPFLFPFTASSRAVELFLLTPL